MMMMRRMSESLSGMLSSAVETMARTSFGQSLLKLVDRFLWVVEKSAEWSLPRQDIGLDEWKGKSFGGMDLVRPLPWILFLPGLILLRLTRACLNVATYVLGYPSIQPSTVVKFVQRSRRRLRTVKTNGMKNLRQRKEKRLSVNEARKALIGSIKLTLSSLSCLDGAKASSSPPASKIRVCRSEAARTPEEKSTTESAGSSLQRVTPWVESKRKYSELSSEEEVGDVGPEVREPEEEEEEEDEPLLCKIDRLASEDSADDRDFNPVDYSSAEDSSTASDGSVESQAVDASEVADIVREARVLLGDVAVAEKTASFETSAELSPATEATASRGLEEPAGFYSPEKLSQEAETAFYSPIGSQSASPERSPSPAVDGTISSGVARIEDSFFLDDQVELAPNDSLELENGKFASPSSSVELTEKLSSEETTNGPAVHDKRGKVHQRGKRANHGSRKKK